MIIFNYYDNNDNLNFFNINICKYLCDLCYCKGERFYVILFCIFDYKLNLLFLFLLVFGI